jgi:uncharacterized membrane-anchored protein
MRTRDEHLAWAKERAREYLDAGDLLNAVTSMGSDLDKHPELGCNAYLLMAGALDAQNGEREKVRRWIEGFR